jgi:hypothetical protein
VFTTFGEVVSPPLAFGVGWLLEWGLAFWARQCAARITVFQPEATMETSMTPLFLDKIVAPSAWTPKSIGGKEGLVRTLDRKHLDAIDRLLASLKSRKTEEITRKDFEDAALTPFLTDIRNEIAHGKCAVIIRGIETGRYSPLECERIFWGFATHWGKATVQSARADRIGYVRDEPDDPVRRGYRSTRELTLHTDSRPVIGLMSIQVAESGGYSQLASSSTIHNIILKERPDLLEPLYRGYPYVSNEIDITPYSIPIFSNVGGIVSCAFFERFMRDAANKLGQTLPPDLDEALTYFAATAQREDVSLNFLLEPGEIMMSNNFVVLHARTEFKNSPEKQRLLVRLWLTVPDIRPLVPELLQRSEAFDRNYDPQYANAS